MWIFVALPGAAMKARLEDRLLAAEFGSAFAEYRRVVPGWIPRLRRRQTGRTAGVGRPQVR